MGLDPAAWGGRRVLVTGHTGFKGSWLSLWLSELGAEVSGFGLAPPTEPSLYVAARVGEAVESREVDVRDREAVAAAARELRPELVVHMAAQPLVRRSFADPLGTYDTNVLGTANVLDAAGRAGARAVLVVTSDKCYAPRADGRPCVEGDPLGGADPYSSSKACAELVAASWRDSFGRSGGPAIATVRAGNVIGGGDWAEDRLVPDAMRAALAGEPLLVRNPDAVRPWQHVLNPLSGYLAVAERLLDGDAAEAWNFGPAPGDELPVRDIADRLTGLWGEGLEWRAEGDGGPPETSVLRLDSAKAAGRLGWSPRWDLDEALSATVDWFRAFAGGAEARAITAAQIAAFSTAGAR
ncbi:MAG TPA: CDP-glucose 4,6-dehydratase [Thermoleophilaceae bacterium]